MAQKFDSPGELPRRFGQIARILSALAIVTVSTPAFSTPAIVLGDSIGVGVSMASGLRRLAHNSVSIQSSADAIAQIRRTPPGTVAFLSLGTNDAVGSIAGVTGGIDRIVDAAHKADVSLVWIGPPCVFKGWNTNVVKLDAILRQRLAGKVPYVSVADEGVCDRSLRAGDGVHFTMQGYQVLWSRARAAAGAEIDAKPVDVAAADTSAESPKKHVHRKKPVLAAEDSQNADAAPVAADAVASIEKPKKHAARHAHHKKPVLSAEESPKPDAVPIAADAVGTVEKPKKHAARHVHHKKPVLSADESQKVDAAAVKSPSAALERN
jgi:hypothetical protein